MKLESTKSKHPQLVYEAKLYKILQGAVGTYRFEGAFLGLHEPQPQTFFTSLFNVLTTPTPQVFPTSVGTVLRISPRVPTMFW